MIVHFWLIAVGGVLPITSGQSASPPPTFLPADYMYDGAYYCNAANSSWAGTEPVCLGRYNSSIITTDVSKGIRLVGGESYGCVELYDNVTQQWGPVRGYRYWRIMKWIDLACRNIGFDGALASSAYVLHNGVITSGFDYLPARYDKTYPPSAPKFVVGDFPQWEGATLHDAVVRVVREECSRHDYDCKPYSLCVSCRGHDTPAQDDSTDIDAHVSCTSDYLEVSFARPTGNSVQATDVQLAAPPCKAEENSTHVYIRTPLGACGTSREDTSDEMIYRNTLSIGADPSHGGITWQQLTKVPVECRLPRNKTLSLDFRPHLMSVFRSGVQGRGAFRISMELFRTDAFLRPVTEYPVFVELREIQVNSSDADLQVFAHTCVATPSDKLDDKIQNDVIVDGCAKLPTLQFYQSPFPDRERFGFQAFAYTSGAGMVYIHCNVLVCNSTDPNSRCAQGCRAAAGRRRREVEGEPTVYRLIQGPIVVGDDKTGSQASDTTFSSRQYLETASIIVGACAILAVAVFAVGTLYNKARQEHSKAGYNVLRDVD
ncbi:hypothetical protein Bbelb_013260 [Branchiostoma belcheri]|nr:hypothetical protein Bbelb_013260 [Branchiostoma belcheri]